VIVPRPRGRLLLPVLLAACAGGAADERPPPTVIPLSFHAEVGLRVGPTATPARAPDGSELVGQTWLQLEVEGVWSEPSPEPGVGCTATWTWPPGADTTPSPDVAAWLAARGAPAGFELRPATAAWAATDCVLIDDVGVEALVGDGIAVALAPSAYLRWQDALAELPDWMAPPPVSAWPWLDGSHVLDATLAVMAPGGGAPIGEHAGVAVALALDEHRHVVPTGGDLLETLAADAFLDAPGAAEALVRATSFADWTLDYPDWTPPPEVAARQPRPP
jgi:hypothetical protein